MYGVSVECVCSYDVFVRSPLSVSVDIDGVVVGILPYVDGVVYIDGVGSDSCSSFGALGLFRVFDRLCCSACNKQATYAHEDCKSQYVLLHGCC